MSRNLDESNESSGCQRPVINRGLTSLGHNICWCGSSRPVARQEHPITLLSLPRRLCCHLCLFLCSTTHKLLDGCTTQLGRMRDGSGKKPIHFGADPDQGWIQKFSSFSITLWDIAFFTFFILLLILFFVLMDFDQFVGAWLNLSMLNMVNVQQSIMMTLALWLSTKFGPKVLKTKEVWCQPICLSFSNKWWKSTAC